MSTFWDTAIGRSATVDRVFTAADLADYSAVTGRRLDPTIVPESLLTGMFSRLLGMDLPGPESLYLNQTLTFAEPARIGETVTARVTVIAVRPTSAVVTLRAVASVCDRVICEGDAVVLARQHPHS